MLDFPRAALLWTSRGPQKFRILSAGTKAVLPCCLQDRDFHWEEGQFVLQSEKSLTSVYYVRPHRVPTLAVGAALH